MSSAIFDVHEGPHAGAETVMLSSGLGGVAGYWKPQVASLGQRHRVVAYDQAGTGRNRRDLAPGHAIEAMADEALSVLDASGTEAAHFVGHALGGLVGLALARRRPDRLRSLTIINGWAAAHAHTRRCFEARLQLLEHGGPAAYVRAQPIFLYPADWLALNEERIAEEEAHGLAGFQGTANLHARIGALLAFDARPWLGEIAVPTLVMAARDDVLVPSTLSGALAGAIPDATLHIASWGAHAINVTEPDGFNSVLLGFLEARAARQ
ncbi:MAG: pyrimidine utilization protein D [Pseudomonadota bacterium]